MSLIQIIIFDFDGVLIESADIKIEAYKELFLQYGNSVAEKAKIYFKDHPGMYRSEKIRQCFHLILNESISNKDIEKQLVNYKHIILDNILAAPWVPGVQNFLENNRKYFLYVVSAAPQDEVRFIAKKRNINHHFKKVFGGPSKKIEVINKISSLEQCSKKEILFIGDAISDYNAALKTEVLFLGRIKQQQSNPFPNDVPTIYTMAELPPFLGTKPDVSYRNSRN